MEEIRKGLKRDVEVQRSSKGGQTKLESQEQFAPKLLPISHTNSVLDVLYMDGKIRGLTFQWNRSNIEIPSESMGNVKTMRHTESITVLY
jgi:hypothetical protein